MKNAEILPLWALTDDPLRLRGNVLTADRAAHARRRVRLVLPPIPKFMIRFFRSYGLFIAAVLFLAVWTLVSCSITASTVRSRTEEAVTIRMEEEMRRRLTAQEITFRAEALMSDGEAMQIADEADIAAQLMEGYGKNGSTKRDLATLLYGALMRVDNAAYPSSLRGVIEQKDQWMFFNPDAPIREDYRSLAMEILTVWHSGHYPADLNSNFVYAEWDHGTVRLRDRWEKNSNTNYWRMPE